jgi:hypothetical protein
VTVSTGSLLARWRESFSNVPFSAATPAVLSSRPSIPAVSRGMYAAKVE